MLTVRPTDRDLYYGSESALELLYGPDLSRNMLYGQGYRLGLFSALHGIWLWIQGMIRPLLE